MNQDVTSRKKKAKSTKWLIGILVMTAAVVAVALTQINSNLVYFYTPDEAVAQAGDLSKKVIKLGGMVTPGKVEWNPSSLDLSFTLSDLKGNDVIVKYKGAPPDLFKEGQGVVAEGKISVDGKSFAARQLMVKHSEEYKKPGDHSQSINKELIEKSMFNSTKNP